MKVKELLEKVNIDIEVFDIRGRTESEKFLERDEVLEKFSEREVSRFFLDFGGIDPATLYICLDGDLFD